MSKMPAGDSLPLTDVAVVADLKKMPNGYDALVRSFDASDDCDLWRDGIFSKMSRYLCLSRKPGSPDNVLADIMLIEEKSVPPAEYRIIEKTCDTGGKATKKQNIAVKFVPRATATQAICDLILLSMKPRKANVGYTTVGQINGLTLCYKMVAVSPPPAAVVTSPPPQPVNSAPLSAVQSPPFHNAGLTPTLPPPRVPPKPTNVRPVTQRMSSLSTSGGSHNSALDNVPFKINAHFNTQVKDMRGLHLTDLKCRSLIDIENEYAYSFAEEYSVAQR